MIIRLLTKPVILAVLLCCSGASAQEAPVFLREEVSVGSQVAVQVRSSLKGTLKVPLEKEKGEQTLVIAGTGAIEYDERILSLDQQNKPDRTIRHYEKLEFRREVGGETQEGSLRKKANPVVILRQGNVEIPFSPAGPLTIAELELIRPDVFTPALLGLLPMNAVKPGDRWAPGPGAIGELTDMDKVDASTLTCTFESTGTVGGRRVAQMTLSGEVKGLDENGPAVHKIDGTFFFDMERKHLAYVSLKGVHSMLYKNGQERGKTEGTFVLTREPSPRLTFLRDEAIQRLTLTPNDDNTMLLHEGSQSGVQFRLPRSWRVAGDNGRQIGVDEVRGRGGLLITAEPVIRVPSAQQFLDEVRADLKKQQAVIRRIEPTAFLTRNIESFTIEADIGKEGVVLQYFVVRQTGGGGTVTVRYSREHARALAPDVERIVRSLQFGGNR